MSRFRLLAVASAKGSPGCTFVATGLAAQFAERGLVTLLVDADAEESGVASFLDLPARPAAAPRLSSLGPLEAASLAETAIRLTPRLHCLSLDARAHGGELALAARSIYGAVVVDLGHRFEALQRAVANSADWLLWIATPDRIGVERADRGLGAGELRAGSTGLVLNRCGEGALADAGAVLTGRHQLPVLARVRASERAAGRLLRQASPPNRAREFRPAFEELARALHPDLQANGGAWSAK